MRENVRIRENNICVFKKSFVFERTRAESSERSGGVQSVVSVKSFHSFTFIIKSEFGFWKSHHLMQDPISHNT